MDSGGAVERDVKGHFKAFMMSSNSLQYLMKYNIRSLMFKELCHGDFDITILIKLL